MEEKMNIKFNIYGADIERNKFDNPKIIKNDSENIINCFIDLDKSGLFDCCFIVMRDIESYKKEKYMFNDMIYLVNENSYVLASQKCDSTAGLNPVAEWSKPGQDAYTLATGIYDIEPTIYQEKNAFELLGGLTKGGYKIGRRSEGGDFSLRHLIHYIGWYENVTEKDAKKANGNYRYYDQEGYRSGSGGCVTIPKLLSGKKNILDYDYLASYKMPTQLIIFEYVNA
jgi:hypothetical protein